MKLWNASTLFPGKFCGRSFPSNRVENCLLFIFQFSSKLILKFSHKFFSRLNSLKLKWHTITVNAWLRRVCRQCMEGKYFLCRFFNDLFVQQSTRAATSRITHNENQRMKICFCSDMDKSVLLSHSSIALAANCPAFFSSQRLVGEIDGSLIANRAGSWRKGALMENGKSTSTPVGNTT